MKRDSRQVQALAGSDQFECRGTSCAGPPGGQLAAHLGTTFDKDGDQAAVPAREPLLENFGADTDRASDLMRGARFGAVDCRLKRLPRPPAIRRPSSREGRHPPSVPCGPIRLRRSRGWIIARPSKCGERRFETGREGSGSNCGRAGSKRHAGGQKRMQTAAAAVLEPRLDDGTVKPCIAGDVLNGSARSVDDIAGQDDEAIGCRTASA